MNRIKEKISQGQLAIGTYVNLADPAVVEMIGIAGYDAAFIDMEHTAFDLETVQEMVRACDLTGICSLVRVPDNSPKTILRVLEMGAQGIQVPHIADRDDALAAVKAVRYAPLGDRGMGGPTRATRYGTVPMKEHIKNSNSDIVLVVMSSDKSDVEGTRRMLHELYELFDKKTGIIINSVPVEHFALKPPENNSVKLEAYQLPVVGVIPCFCDVRNVGGSCLFVAEKPNHPFTKILQEIATTLSVKMGNAVKTKPEPLALKECSQ